MTSTFRLLLTLAALGSCRALQASTVTAAAEISSGLSYKADPALANSNSAIAGNGALKAAVMNGNDLLAGNLVLVGSFNISDLAIKAGAMNPASLLSSQNFVPFGTLHINDGYPSQPGWFVKSFDNDATQLGIAGRQIYMVALASTDNSTPARSIATAFQIGIFYEKAVRWKFRDEADVPNDTSIDLSDLTLQQDGTALDDNAHVIVGAFGPDASDAAPSATNFVLASIPEPSAGWLAVLGVLACRRPRRLSI